MTRFVPMKLQCNLAQRPAASLAALAWAVFIHPAVAEDPVPFIPPPTLYEEVLVTGGKEAIRTLAGSATFVDQEAIERFNVTDVTELMAEVPGVYIRHEDGYGLRPNIGIRGATAERSQKITLMEDGVLIAPAPYAAPAAYYLPNVNRMSAVEVFKGPAAIHYGPHTVGGAVNMVTAPVPEQSVGEVNLTYGTDAYYKGRVFYGDGGEGFGWWVDALSYGADGFKELDTGGDTGFQRNDLNTKLQWRTAADADIAQRLEIKVGYADETSHETYLGLTDADFADNPLRRYSASQLDRFDSEHAQLHALHSIDFGGGWTLVTRAYLNRFDRAWNKFDGFLPADSAGEDPYANRLGAALLLQNAGNFPTRMAIVRGQQDSSDAQNQTLDITNNAREYGSQGLAVNGTYDWQFGSVEHSLSGGLRYHQDYVERNHQVRGYRMQNGELLFDGVADRPSKAMNRAEADALALFFSDAMTFGRWQVDLGVRLEQIDGEVDDKLSDSVSRNSQQVVMPGIGVFYQVTDALGLLAGVNKGFSPSGPGAAEHVDPEESINYEYGLRYRQEALTVDAIGFFSDYSNLLGRCRVSDAGCDVGEEFNGGRVEIAGLEFTAGYALELGEHLSVPLNLVYTYTESAFQTGFRSGFSQWGLVQPGDELPYLPEHQGRFLTGLRAAAWALDLSINYTGDMREAPGQDPTPRRQRIDSLTTLGLAIRYDLGNALSLQLVGTNVTDEQQVVSRRPFGARPNQPRMLKLGATYRF